MSNSNYFYDSYLFISIYLSIYLFIARCQTNKDYQGAYLCTMATAKGTGGGKKGRKFLIVGALDFGTSYSGYAYSYSYGPTRVYTRQWCSSTRGITVEKTLTCILFDKNKTFKAFGFKAEEDYGMYCDEGKKSDWYFFKGSKLDLYDEMCLKQDNTITDELGREFSLFDIVAETLRYPNGELMWWIVKSVRTHLQRGICYE